MFVTLKVFKLIGPSNDSRRHGRGTYLFLDIPLSNCLSLFGWILTDWVALPSPPPTSPAWTAEAGGDVDVDMAAFLPNRSLLEF
jgi:hypothetical protein